MMIYYGDGQVQLDWLLDLTLTSIWQAIWGWRPTLFQKNSSQENDKVKKYTRMGRRMEVHWYI